MIRPQPVCVDRQSSLLLVYRIEKIQGSFKEVYFHKNGLFSKGGKTGLQKSARIPAPRIRVIFNLQEKAFDRGLSQAMERSLILLKPDCVQRRLIGAIISRFEEKAIDVVGLKMIQVTPDLAKKHYAEHVEKPFYPGLEEFITGAPVVAMVLQGLDVVRVVREMLGATNGLTAAPGTIRGDYSSSRQMNLVHASDGAEAAAREIDLYFNANEICDYSPCLTPWFRAGDEA
jgi:nucleoside-diphosphate kinase